MLNFPAPTCIKNPIVGACQLLAANMAPATGSLINGIELFEGVFHIGNSSLCTILIFRLLNQPRDLLRRRNIAAAMPAPIKTPFKILPTVSSFATAALNSFIHTS